MRHEGIEPPRDHSHRLLRTARLPVPPMSHNLILQLTNCFFWITFIAVINPYAFTMSAGAQFAYGKFATCSNQFSIPLYSRNKFISQSHDHYICRETNYNPFLLLSHSSTLSYGAMWKPSF